MGFIYSGSNTTLPIGRVEDYNNTNPSRSVAIYRTLQTSGTPMSFSPEVKHNTQFAKSIYNDGHYSLLRPNSTSNVLAQNIDLMA